MQTTTVAVWLSPADHLFMSDALPNFTIVSPLFSINLRRVQFLQSQGRCARRQ